MGEDIVTRVESYLQRAKKTNSIPLFPLGREGLYQIIGGKYGGAKRSKRYDFPVLIEGRFADVVAYALQQSEFYGEFCSKDEPDNNNCGYIVKGQIKKLKPKKVKAKKGKYDIVKTLKERERALAKRTKIENELREIGKTLAR